MLSAVFAVSAKRPAMSVRKALAHLKLRGWEIFIDGCLRRLHIVGDEDNGLVQHPLQAGTHPASAGALLLTARTLAGAGLFAPFESSPRSKPRSTRR